MNHRGMAEAIGNSRRGPDGSVRRSAEGISAFFQDASNQTLGRFRLEIRRQLSDRLATFCNDYRRSRLRDVIQHLQANVFEFPRCNRVHALTIGIAIAIWP